MGINVHKTAAIIAEALLLMAIATGSSVASESRNPSGLLQASGASLEPRRAPTAGQQTH